MQADQLPDVDGLVGHRIFGLLTADERRALAARSSLLAVGAADIALPAGQILDYVAVIEHGAVELADPAGEWSLRLEAGECFGAGLAPLHAPAPWSVRAITDCRLRLLPVDEVAALGRPHPWLAHFFPYLASGQAAGAGSGSPPRPRVAGDAVDPTAAGADGTLNLLSTPLRSLIKRAPVTVAPTETIRAVAELMREQRVSSVLLVEQGHLFGLITDRDLRNRVVSQSLPTDRPVVDIATLAPITLPVSATGFEAMLLMARQNIHHLPLMDGQRIAGMITATDLAEQQSLSAVYLVGDVYKQDSVEGLVRVAGRIKLLQQQLAAADAGAHATGHIISAVTDALTVRLIHLAEARLGPPPVEFVWVAAGSQGRSEQTARSDQDNALILDDAYDAERHGSYFAAFARFVCDGLDACGYIHCPGGMMAMTPDWCQPLGRWIRYFRQWIGTPEPKALMLTSVFFDMRAVHGRTALLASLRADVLRQTRGNTLFLAHMVANAMSHRPPLGLFGQIAAIRSGPNAGCVDLKHGGTGPVVELARVLALAGASESVNTDERLEKAAHGGDLGERSARELRDAFEFIAKLRIAHQARQTAAGGPADNFLPLSALSNFERGHLKAALSVVAGVQDLLGQRYQSGRF